MYSRQSPSPRYLALLQQNRQLHLEGNPAQNVSAENAFPGKSLFPQLARIRRLVQDSGATSLLDYGCGKGQQYQATRIVVEGKVLDETVQDYLDVDYIYRYDGAYPLYTKLPDGRFDGVICTDVLEHCPVEDLPWIVDELFSYANKFVFASVANYPASKHLPNGDNAHCTQLDTDFWGPLFETTAARHPGIGWEVWCISRRGPAEAPLYTEERLGSSKSTAQMEAGS